MNIVDNKQLLYSLIYSLNLIKSKFLKIYIKINLANNYFKTLKLFTNFSIFFIYKKIEVFIFVFIIEVLTT